MILPLLLSPYKTVITVTPLKLLQHDHEYTILSPYVKMSNLSL